MKLQKLHVGDINSFWGIPITRNYDYDSYFLRMYSVIYRKNKFIQTWMIQPMAGGPRPLDNLTINVMYANAGTVKSDFKTS